MKQQFQISQQFRTRGKAPCLCTIVDVWRTYNVRGEMVRLRYVAKHQFMGQTITDHGVCETTIAMGAVEQEGGREASSAHTALTPPGNG
jgi:hypothetical protein